MATPTNPAEWDKITNLKKRTEDVCQWHREQEQQTKSKQEEKK